MIDKSEPAEYIFRWLFSEIFLSMLNWTQKTAENLPWIEVSINHVWNDNFRKSVFQDVFKVNIHSILTQNFMTIEQIQRLEKV